ncbi:MAG: nucleotidyltransferase domain-containing protein [Pseudolabrys sp.]
MNGSGLSSALFSNVQKRVLALIFGHPDRSFYTSEIIQSIGSGTGAVERELSRLKLSGLVSAKRIGNQTHYQANRQSPIFGELQSLISKTMGLAEPLRDSLEPLTEKIKAAFVYGSVAQGKDNARSDIDLMVVGEDLTYPDIYTELQKAESVLRRKVNPNFLSLEDWRKKVAQKNSFISKVNSLPKIFIIGSQNDLHL